MISFLREILSMLLIVMQFALIARIIFSMLPGISNGFVKLVYNITEPMLVPIRSFLARFEFFNNSMLDFSTFFAWIILMMLKAIL